MLGDFDLLPSAATPLLEKKLASQPAVQSSLLQMSGVNVGSATSGMAPRSSLVRHLRDWLTQRPPSFLWLMPPAPTLGFKLAATFRATLMMCLMSTICLNPVTREYVRGAPMLPSGAIAALQPTLGATVLFMARMATGALTSLAFNLAVINLFAPSITVTLVALFLWSFLIGYLDTSTTYQRFTLATCAMVLCQWWQDLPQFDATFAVHVGVGHALVSIAAVIITALPSPGYASATREVGNRLRLLHFATRNELAALAVAFTHGTELEHTSSGGDGSATVCSAGDTHSVVKPAAAGGVPLAIPAAASQAQQAAHGAAAAARMSAAAAQYYSKLALFPELHVRDSHGHGHEATRPGGSTDAAAAAAVVADGTSSGSGAFSPASPLYSETSPVALPVSVAAKGTYVPPSLPPVVALPLSPDRVAGVAAGFSSAVAAAGAGDVSIEMRMAAAAAGGVATLGAGGAAASTFGAIGRSPTTTAVSAGAGSSVLLFAPKGHEQLLQSLYGHGAGAGAGHGSGCLCPRCAPHSISGAAGGAAVASSERASLLRADIDALEAFGGEQLGFLSRCLGDMRYEPSLFLSETLPQWLRGACRRLACSSCCKAGGCCSFAACCSCCCCCCCASTGKGNGGKGSSAGARKLPQKRERLQAWARAQQALHRVLQSLSAAERHVPASPLHALFMSQLRQPLCKLVLDVSRLYGAGLAWSARTRWTRRRGCCSGSSHAAGWTADDLSHGTTHWNAWFPGVGYPGEPVPSSHSEILRLRAAVMDDAAAFFGSLHRTRLSLASACCLAVEQTRAAVLPSRSSAASGGASAVTAVLSTQRSFVGETSWFALPRTSLASTTAVAGGTAPSQQAAAGVTGSRVRGESSATAAAAAVEAAAAREDALALVQAVQRNEASSLLSFLFQSLRCAQIVVDAVNEACALPEPAAGADAAGADAVMSHAASKAYGSASRRAAGSSPAAPPAAAVVVPIPIVYQSSSMGVVAAESSSSPMAGSPGAGIEGSIDMTGAASASPGNDAAADADAASSTSGGHDDATGDANEAGLPETSDASAATLSIAVSPRVLLWTPTMGSEALTAHLTPSPAAANAAAAARVGGGGSINGAAGGGNNAADAASASVKLQPVRSPAMTSPAAPAVATPPARKRPSCCRRFCAILLGFWLYTQAAWGLRFSWTQARRGLQVSGVMTLSAGLAIAMQLYLFPEGRYAFWAPQTGA